ncbi:hypothetical protein OF001_U280024 [Pseudomonas sp. OF001]|nr:hypothetical protein OF001_U280024 [Pseudomonas sp. OF001]
MSHPSFFCCSAQKTAILFLEPRSRYRLARAFQTSACGRLRRINGALRHRESLFRQLKE